MEVLREFTAPAQTGVDEEIQTLLEETGIKQQVLDEARRFALEEAMHILNPGQGPEPKVFPGISFDNADDRDQFLLILDYLESVGLKFAPQILKFESRNPQIAVDREDLCRRLKLRAYDQTPLLVQLVEQRYLTVQRSK
jgi:hypothetical protein